MYDRLCMCAQHFTPFFVIYLVTAEESLLLSSLIFPLGHFDGWINNARMKARRLYHYIENNWVQSKLMITGKPSQKFHQNLLLLLLPMINNNRYSLWQNPQKCSDEEYTCFLFFLVNHLCENVESFESKLST